MQWEYKGVTITLNDSTGMFCYVADGKPSRSASLSAAKDAIRKIGVATFVPFDGVFLGDYRSADTFAVVWDTYRVIGVEAVRTTGREQRNVFQIERSEPRSRWAAKFENKPVVVRDTPENRKILEAFARADYESIREKARLDKATNAFHKAIPFERPDQP